MYISMYKPNIGNIVLEQVKVCINVYSGSAYGIFCN